MESKVIAVQFGNKAKPAEKNPAEGSAALSGALLPSAQAQQATLSTDEKNDLRSLAERNRANQERLRKEREQASKAVLKSYRIK